MTTSLNPTFDRAGGVWTEEQRRGARNERPEQRTKEDTASRLDHASGASQFNTVLPSDSDLDTFWAAGMRFTTGVSVITLGAGNEIHGATVSAFTMVSRRPALISLCISTSSGLTDQVISNRSFAVNILSRGQEGLARRFADPGRGYGPIEFAGVPYVPGFGAGVPLLTGALCWLCCQFRRVVPAGDHQIVLGGVTAVQQGKGQPLLYFGGRLHTAAIEEPA